MFTGLIEEIGTLLSSDRRGRVHRLSLRAHMAGNLQIGDSICIDGVCQTVVEARSGTFHVEATGETLRRTTLATWTGPREVNLERALQVDGRLDGHLVSGHTDGTARLIRRREEGSGVWFDLLPPPALIRFIAPQGSVTLDGVSLTVASFREGLFSVSLVPHTLQNTTLGHRRQGDYLNLEVDILARYVARLLAAGHREDSRRREGNEWV